MASETQPEPLLSQVGTGIAELERAVQGFELEVVDVEKLMGDVERLEAAGSQAAHQALIRALHTSYNAAQRILAINTDLDEDIASAEKVVRARELANENNRAPFPNGTLILGGRYRLIQLLCQRPRVHLYLARRLSDSPIGKTDEQPLVAIREIVLAGLAPDLRLRIEQAAFAEFVAPRHFGSPHLPSVGDRLQVEHARHYLVVQPHQTRGRRPVFATTLAEFLPTQSQDPGLLEMSTALHWGIQLCLTVARLHRLKHILGELTPEMIVVARTGRSDWAPLILPAWPPAPSFWHGNSEQEVQELYNQIFPVAAQESMPTEAGADTRPFAAPEVFTGQRNERSDIYTLGALLYLLITRRVPTPAARRLRAEPMQPAGRGYRLNFKASLLRLLAAVPGTSQQFILTPPHLLNMYISPLLEHILLRALALNPEQRFASVLDLAKALEGMKLKTDTSTPEQAGIPRARVSQMRKLLERLKKEINE
jgi:hypothetical protein